MGSRPLLFLAALILLIGALLAIIPGILDWRETLPKGEERLLISKTRTSQMHSLAFVSDLKLASAGGDGGITVWDTTNGKEIARYMTDGDFGPMYSLAFARQYDLLLGTSRHDGWTWQIGSIDRATRYAWPDLRLDESFLVMAREGSLAVIQEGVQRMLVWDVLTGQRLHTLTPEGAVSHPVITPDRQAVIAVTYDRNGLVFYRWELLSGKDLGALHGAGLTACVYCLAISPDGKWLAGGCDDGTTRIWLASTGEEVQGFPSSSPLVSSVQFSPDGSHLASAGRDSKIRVWQTKGWQEKDTLEHGAWVNCLAFSPDGKTLASAGETSPHALRHGAFIKLWDIQ